MNVKEEFDELYLSFCNEYDALLKSDAYISKSEYKTFINKYEIELDNISENSEQKKMLKNIINNIDTIINKHNDEFKKQ